MKSNVNTIINLYGMAYKPTDKQTKDRETKTKEAIEYLGNKYLLAKPTEKTNGYY